MTALEVFYGNWRKLNWKIAVIGSGTPSKEYGKEIDNHDMVIRCNLAPIDGYEKLVGTRKDINCVGSFTMLDKQFFPEKLEGYAYYWSLYTKDRNMDIHNNHNWCMPEREYFIEAQRLLNVRKPTTGFVLLYSMYMNKVKADVYCMDFLKTNPYYTEEASKLFEFFKDHEVRGFDKVHSPDKEKLFWEEVDWHKFNK